MYARANSLIWTSERDARPAWDLTAAHRPQPNSLMARWKRFLSCKDDRQAGPTTSTTSTTQTATHAWGERLERDLVFRCLLRHEAAQLGFTSIHLVAAEDVQQDTQTHDGTQRAVTYQQHASNAQEEGQQKKDARGALLLDVLDGFAAIALSLLLPQFLLKTLLLRGLFLLLLCLFGLLLALLFHLLLALRRLLVLPLDLLQHFLGHRPAVLRERVAGQHARLHGPPAQPHTP